MEEKHKNFIAAVRKREVLGATKVKMSGSEKKSEQEHIQHFLQKTCTQEVSEFHVVVVQNNGKVMIKKSVPSFFCVNWEKLGLRGRSSKGKGKGIRARDRARGRRQEGMSILPSPFNACYAR